MLLQAKRAQSTTEFYSKKDLTGSSKHLQHISLNNIHKAYKLFRQTNIVMSNA